MFFWRFQRMKKVVLGLLVSLLLWGCSSTKPNDSDAVNDALIGFTVNAQASRWQEALVFVTPDEVDEITDGNGIMKQEYRVAAKRMKLSTLKQMEWEWMSATRNTRFLMNRKL